MKLFNFKKEDVPKSIVLLILSIIGLLLAILVSCSVLTISEDFPLVKKLLIPIMYPSSTIGLIYSILGIYLGHKSKE